MKRTERAEVRVVWSWELVDEETIWSSSGRSRGGWKREFPPRQLGGTRARLVDVRNTAA